MWFGVYADDRIIDQKRIREVVKGRRMEGYGADAGRLWIPASAGKTGWRCGKDG